MAVSVVMRAGPDAGDRAYAVEKFERLAARFADVHDVRLTLGIEGHHGPSASAEAVVHQLHSHFAARSEGTTAREAIDLLLAKVDRRLAQEKDREKDREHRATDQ